MSVEDVREWDLRVWVAVWNGAATAKTAWQVLPWLNTESPYDPAVSLPGSSPREMKTYVYTKNLHTNGHSSTSHNKPKVETTQMSVKDPGGKPRMGEQLQVATFWVLPNIRKEKMEMGKFLLEHFCCAVLDLLDV